MVTKRNSKKAVSFKSSKTIFLAYKNKNDKLIIKKTKINVKDLHKYGKYKTENGKVIYARKEKFENEKGQIRTKAKPINKYKYFKNSNGAYIPYVGDDVILITERNVDPKTNKVYYDKRLRSIEELKYAYKRVGKSFERKPGPRYVPETNLTSKDIPKVGRQLKAELTYEINGKKIKVIGFSKSQSPRSGFSVEQMQQQAYNHTLSKLVTKYGIPYDVARRSVYKARFKVGKRLG